MTEKEKAIELVEKFYDNDLTSLIDEEQSREKSKQCALVDINNTIEALEYHSWQNRKQIEYYKTIRTHIIEMK
jgi:hypothetical protein